MNYSVELGLPGGMQTASAIVRTATVAVKALHIGTKQVTLAVFRQLKDEDIIDVQTGQLKGVPWGTVNYFWGNCVAGTHMHVVWQKGAELRRCCLHAHLHENREGAKLLRAVQDADHRIFDAARLATAAMIGCAPRTAFASCDAWEKAQVIVAPVLVRNVPYSVNIAWDRRLMIQGYPDRASKVALGEAFKVIAHYLAPPQEDLGEAHPLWAIIAEAASHFHVTLPAEHSEWEAHFRRQAGFNWQAWEAMQHDYDDAVTTWREHYDAITQLDQLFIAV